MDDITVIVVTSVLPSHPSTEIVEETIASIRHHLPNSEIILQIDGLRDEQSHRLNDYNEYKTRVLWNCLHKWTNVRPIVFKEHSHQSTMMNETIELVETDKILYVEGDCPLVVDAKIDWDKCTKFIDSGEAYTIRFHFEAQIPEPHKHLMLKTKGDFLQTIQWSQRPHLTTKEYYQNIVLPDTPPTTFIEDTFHGTIQQNFSEHGMKGWYRHRLWIYHPKGSIKRSTHLDGRAGGKKFTTDDEVWGL